MITPKPVAWLSSSRKQKRRKRESEKARERENERTRDSELQGLRRREFRFPTIHPKVLAGGNYDSDLVGQDSYLDTKMSILENRPTIGQLKPLENGRGDLTPTIDRCQRALVNRHGSEGARFWGRRDLCTGLRASHRVRVGHQLDYPCHACYRSFHRASC